MKPIKEILDARLADAIGDLFYYDRKEDEELPAGAIEAAMDAGEVSEEWILERLGWYLSRATA